MKFKIYILLLLSFLIHHELEAQDLIVFNTKDSINCKILKDDNEKTIEIAIKIKDNIEISTVKMVDILSIRKNYFVITNNSKPDCYDSIFTKEGEIIIGKITEDKTDWYVNYELTNHSKHSIPYSSIKNVVKCKTDSTHLLDKNLPIKTVKNNSNETISNVFENKKYRLGFDGIFAFRPALGLDKVSKTVQNHFKQLLLNFGLGVDFQFAIDKKRTFLLGLHASSIFASAKTPNIQLTTTTGNVYRGELVSNIQIHSLGPNFLVKLGKGKSLHNWAFKFGMNLIYYAESMTISNYNLAISGLSITQSLNLLYDYKIDKNLTLGANLGLDGGTISTIFVDENGKQYTKNLPSDEQIGLGRITLSAGIRYWF